MIFIRSFINDGFSFREWRLLMASWRLRRNFFLLNADPSVPTKHFSVYLWPRLPPLSLFPALLLDNDYDNEKHTNI